jgi:hypothetical protein
MYDEQLKSLLNRWKNAFGQYEKLKKEVEQTIVRWEYAAWERYSPLPFHFQRFPGRGRVLKGDPASENSFTQYGFDVQDRIQVQKDCVKLVRSSNFNYLFLAPVDLEKDPYYRTERYYQYSENLIEAITYSVYPHIPLDIQQIALADNQVIFHTWFRLNGYTSLYGKKGKYPDELYEWLGYNGRFTQVESYFYEENRVSRISGYYESPGVPPYAADEYFTYDPAGKLLHIDEVSENGHKRVIYQKRQKGQTFKKIREEAMHKLVDTIVQKIKMVNIQEKIYCIELNYQQCSQYFPPYIITVPESYRLKLLQSSDPSARFNIFCPIPENGWFFTIDDPETLEICQILEQEIHTGEKWDTATRILRDIATILTHQEWSNTLDTTPDFVVFALDAEMEGDQMLEILSSSVSDKQIQEWKCKGWLIGQTRRTNSTNSGFCP